MSVDAANDIAEFLASRRARVTPGAGRAAQLRRATRQGPAARGGRLAGRRQRRVLQAPGARQRQRRVRQRARGARPALQLDDAERAHLFDLARAASPVAPKRRRPAQQRVRPRAADPRLDHRTRQSCATAASTTSPPTRSAARSTRRCSRAASSRPTAPASRSLTRRAGVLRRLGAHRERPRRAPALRGRPQPIRPWPLRPGRRALDTQPGVPHLVGGAQRPLPPDRHQAPASPGGGRARARVRGDGRLRRRRTDDRRLQRRAGQPLRGGARPARKLDRHARAREHPTEE